MLDILKELCAIDGTSGHEDKVREYIINHIGDNEYTVDNLGNLIVNVKNLKQDGKMGMDMIKTINP